VSKQEQEQEQERERERERERECVCVYVWIDLLVAAYDKGRVWRIWCGDTSQHKNIGCYVPPLLYKLQNKMYTVKQERQCSATTLSGGTVKICVIHQHVSW